MGGSKPVIMISIIHSNGGSFRVRISLFTIIQ